MTALALTLYVGNDNVLTLTGLQNGLDSSYLNSATVDVTLEDSSGTEVAGDTWPLTMPYIAASNGVYRVTLLDTLTITAGETYTAKISANAGSGLQGYWEIPVTAQARTT